MNIVIISTGSRPALLRQTFDSMKQNALRWADHTTTLVLDGCIENIVETWRALAPDCTIVNSQRRGASESRNIGAGSIPRASRHERLMFCDDDCFFLSRWDEAYEETFLKTMPLSVVSGYSHPFNHPTIMSKPTFNTMEVVSTVAMAMSWKLWDTTGGHFELPGGAGGSEDYEICMRAKAAGAHLVTTKEPCVIHCGLTSSTGKPIVGMKELEALNHSLIMKNGLQGKVVML